MVKIQSSKDVFFSFYSASGHALFNNLKMKNQDEISVSGSIRDG